MTLLIQWPLYSTGYLRGDEYNFIFEYSNQSPLAQFWNIENKLGYGSLFWILISVLKVFTGHPGEIFKCSLLIIYLCVSFCLFLKSAPRLRWVLLFLMLGAPCFWWYGKIVSVELPGCLLGLLGGWGVIHSKKVVCKNLGWMTLGVAIGLKPLFGIFFLYCVLRQTESPKQLTLFLKSCGWGCLGFFIANPFILLAPGNYFQELSSVSQVLRPSPKILFSALFGSEWTYDLVYSGSLFKLLFHPASFILIWILFFFSLPKREVLWGIGCIGLLVFTLTTNEIYYGWYLFPVYYLVVLIFSSLSWNRYVKWGSLGIVIVQALFTAPIVFDQISLRRQYIADFESSGLLRNCIQKTFNSQVGAAKTLVYYSLLQGPDIIAFKKYGEKKVLNEYEAFDFFKSPQKIASDLPRPIWLGVSQSFVSRGILSPWEKTRKNVEEAIHSPLKEIGSCGSTTVFWVD